MTRGCPTGFPEELLSGRLDGELTQAEDQRVRVHLEDCPSCRRLYLELQTLREAAVSTEFSVPDRVSDLDPDLGAEEKPLTPASRVLRWLGWALLVVYALTIPALWLGRWVTFHEDLFVWVLLVSALGGFGLLLASLVLDRIRSAKTDRYRRVKK